MELLALAEELGLKVVKTSATCGGEYHSSCPLCSGKDRFVLWPQKGRYWCRRCDKKGDAIQFCRDFMGMDYRSACVKVGVEARTPSHDFLAVIKKPRFSPIEANRPSKIWQTRAEAFMLQCHESLSMSSQAKRLMQERGLSLETAKLFLLGWNNADQFLPFSDWDLTPSVKDDGKERKLWLPKGLIVPTVLEGKVVKLKVRRSDWSIECSLPKYVEVSGSMASPSLYGNASANVIVLVEAEFDAILIQQFAADLCCCMAIGGAGKKPDLNADKLLRNASLILFALDFDEAGKKAYRFWQSTYSNLRGWPVPCEKSPGDAFQKGIDLRQWIEAGTAA